MVRLQELDSTAYRAQKLLGQQELLLPAFFILSSNHQLASEQDSSVAVIRGA